MNTNSSAATLSPPFSRRQFLQWSAASAASMGFPHAGQPARATHAPARCDAVILLWMQGGMSHLDTLDPKPCAPSDIRGPFKAIGTNVPGIQLCEHLPRLARVADKITLVRSLWHDEAAHERGRSLLFGAWQQLRQSIPPGASSPDSSAEPPKLRESYGNTPLGRKCLAARRLVETGARFVTVQEDGWDHHFRVFDALKNRLPAFDLAVSALIRDLAARGLLDRTLVVCATEFGRSPRINNEAGREHHPAVFSCLLAGGGMAGGQVIGASDARGEAPASQPMTPDNLLGLIAAQLGLHNPSPAPRTA
jgi:hypothetical protein